MPSMSKPFDIAIDGPVAAGKGTVSRQVADQLGFLYVDTGAMYRCAAYLALQNKIDFEDVTALVKLINSKKIELKVPDGDKNDGRLATILLDGEDVTWKIRTEEVSSAVPHVAKLPEIRKIMVAKQQQIAENQDVVMEGRDITTRVLPEADLKIFMTASSRVRAQRRLKQLIDRGEILNFKEVYNELLERDTIDSSRQTDPLTIADGAWVIDTSKLSIKEVVTKIIERVNNMRRQHDTR